MSRQDPGRSLQSLQGVGSHSLGRRWGSPGLLPRDGTVAVWRRRAWGRCLFFSAIFGGLYDMMFFFWGIYVMVLYGNMMYYADHLVYGFNWIEWNIVGINGIKLAIRRFHRI